jgi:type IV secretion system protein VirB8
MNQMSDENLEEYYQEAESWSQDRQSAADRSVRIAWIVAGIAALVAMIEAVALTLLVTQPRDVPYIITVDRQTGFVQRLNPLSDEAVTADAALTRSMLAQYVIARESFAIDNLQENYRKVGLWSGGEARERYLASVSTTNPQSPLATLPRRATIDVTIRSVSSLSNGTSLVRFSTVRTDPGARPQVAQNWASVVSYQFSAAGMSDGDRLTNPLGFQVTRYRRDAETLPEATAQSLPEAPPLPSTVDDVSTQEPAQ